MKNQRMFTAERLGIIVLIAAVAVAAAVMIAGGDKESPAGTAAPLPAETAAKPDTKAADTTAIIHKEKKGRKSKAGKSGTKKSRETHRNRDPRGEYVPMN